MTRKAELPRDPGCQVGIAVGDTHHVECGIAQQRRKVSMRADPAEADHAYADADARHARKPRAETVKVNSEAREMEQAGNGRHMVRS
jgi:hypothetical protein